jgi:NTE family protein
MLSHPVPTQPLREMGAERVLAVHLRGQWARNGAPRHLFDVIGQSFAIAQDRMAPLWKGAADLVIEPDVAAFEYDDFKRAADLVRAGEEAMRKALPEVRSWMESPKDVALPQKTGIPAKARPAMAKPAPMSAD